MAVGVLVVALASSSTDSLGAGDLLAHGTVVWLTNIITFACCSGCSTRAARSCLPTAVGQTPTSGFRRTPCNAPVGARA